MIKAFIGFNKEILAMKLPYWLVAVIVFDSISLVIDVVDVARYWMGERQPILTADNNEF